MIAQHYNINSTVNVARKIKCYVSKSKLALSECNGTNLSAIAFVVFTPHEVKQSIVFRGHPVVYRADKLELYITPSFVKRKSKSTNHDYMSTDSY